MLTGVAERMSVFDLAERQRAITTLLTNMTGPAGPFVVLG